MKHRFLKYQEENPSFYKVKKHWISHWKGGSLELERVILFQTELPSGNLWISEEPVSFSYHPDPLFSVLEKEIYPDSRKQIRLPGTRLFLFSDHPEEALSHLTEQQIHTIQNYFYFSAPDDLLCIHGNQLSLLARRMNGKNQKRMQQITLLFREIRNESPSVLVPFRKQNSSHTSSPKQTISVLPADGPARKEI